MEEPAKLGTIAEKLKWALSELDELMTGSDTHWGDRRLALIRSQIEIPLRGLLELRILELEALVAQGTLQKPEEGQNAQPPTDAPKEPDWAPPLREIVTTFCETIRSISRPLPTGFAPPGTKGNPQ